MIHDLAAIRSVHSRLTGITFVNANSQNADDTQDGGAFLFTDSSVTIDGCLFTNNAAPGAGGAINVLNNELVITDTTFQANTAQNGGALALTRFRLNMGNTQFMDNTADAAAAIIYFRGQATLQGTKFYRNTSPVRLLSFSRKHVSDPFCRLLLLGYQLTFIVFCYLAHYRLVEPWRFSLLT
jgi:hypothetical protein